MRSVGVLLGLLISWSAAAQVTIDLRALDALPPLPGAQPRPVTRPATPPQPTAPQPTAPSATTPRQASANARLPSVPPAPEPLVAAPSVPPPASDIPPVAAPARAAPAPAAFPPPVSSTSATQAAETQTGLRVTFEPAGTDLSPASMELIRRFAGTVPTADSVTVDVVAFASGASNDQSAARRLSLSRGLAVRSALIAEGVTPSRIYVRALGARTDGQPPDRVDIVLLGTNTAR